MVRVFPLLHDRALEAHFIILHFYRILGADSVHSKELTKEQTMATNLKTKKAQKSTTTVVATQQQTEEKSSFALDFEEAFGEPKPQKRLHLLGRLRGEHNISV